MEKGGRGVRRKVRGDRRECMGECRWRGVRRVEGKNGVGNWMEKRGGERVVVGW